MNPHQQHLLDLYQIMLYNAKHGYHCWMEYHRYGGHWKGGWIEWLCKKGQ